MNQEKLLAGAVKVDITPPLGTVINGDHTMHYAHTIHDPMYAKAMVLNSGETTVAIMVVDICAMDQGLLYDVKLNIEKQTGIPTQNILISSTHTHAAGSVMSLLLSPADLPYRQKLPGLLIEAVVKANAALQPAKIGFCSVDVPEHLLCRRYKMKEDYAPPNPVSGKADRIKTNPFGLEHLIVEPTTELDPQVSYLAVQNTNGAWISLLANYSLHYVGDWENGTITADYFGEFAIQLQEKLGAGDDFIGIMSNGTSGEVNIWDFKNPDRHPKEHFAKSKLIGGDIANKVAQSMLEVEWQETAELGALSITLPMGVRKPTEQELEKAKKLVSAYNFENLSIEGNGMEALYAREQVMLNEYKDTYNFPIQAIKIGDGVIGALGGEFFSETGLNLKKNADAVHYFTITMANDYIGYVPPAHEIEMAGMKPGDVVLLSWKKMRKKLSEKNYWK